MQQLKEGFRVVELIPVNPLFILQPRKHDSQDEGGMGHDSRLTRKETAMQATRDRGQEGKGCMQEMALCPC